MAHLYECQLLSDRQHAFWKRHSCEAQLTTIINDWVQILNTSGQADIGKAFDTLPHELLKSKLFGYGVGGKTPRWIDSFFAIEHKELL